MYERNFPKRADSENVYEEALGVKTDKANSTRIDREKKIRNYCKKEGHWVVSCKKWIADGRPPKKTEDSLQSNVLDTNVTLCFISKEVCTAESDWTGWWIDNEACDELSRFLHRIRNVQSPCIIRALLTKTRPQGG